jgi:hypothetical protein
MISRIFEMHIGAQNALITLFHDLGCVVCMCRRQRKRPLCSLERQRNCSVVKRKRTSDWNSMWMVEMSLVYFFAETALGILHRSLQLAKKLHGPYQDKIMTHANRPKWSKRTLSPAQHCSNLCRFAAYPLLWHAIPQAHVAEKQIEGAPEAWDLSLSIIGS